MVTKKNVEKYTVYSDETIKSEGSFSSCVLNPLEKLNNFKTEFLLLGKEKVRDKNMVEDLIKVKKEILLLTDSEIRDAHYLAGKGENGKENTKEYFSTTSPHHVEGNSDKTILLIEQLLNKISGDSHNLLNYFENKFTALLERLKENTRDLYNKEADVKLVTSKRDAVVAEWKIEYNVLKGHTKTECIRKNIDYKIFFYDLMYKKSSSSSNNKKDEENIVVDADTKEEVVED